MKRWQVFANGIFRENPIFRLVLGMCPVLAVSTAVVNGLGMGLAATAVLVCSNVIISLLRNIIPKEVRIPCFIVVVATFVTIVDKVMAASAPGLHQVLGIFIPLIVVNCIILGRAEAFASKNSVGRSLLDGMGMGLGFTLGLVLLSFFRELLGEGTFLVAKDFGFPGLGLISEGNRAKIFVMAPGAFITLGLLLAGINKLSAKLSAARAHTKKGGA